MNGAIRVIFMKDTAFDSHQFDAIYPEGVENHFWTHARNCIIAHTLGRHELRGKKILEIGCGKGIVVQSLRSKGYDCWGVELANVATQENIQEYLYTHTDALALPAQIRDSFEVILFLDMIEHLPEPEKFLYKIIQKYPRAHHMIFTVPARQELWSNYDEFNHHFRRYDIATMKKLMEQCHMQRVEVNYFFHLLYPFMRIIALFLKRRSVHVQSPVGIMRVLHRILAQFFYGEYLVFPKQGVGTSLICYAYRGI